jgi:hypothetical protein
VERGWRRGFDGVVHVSLVLWAAMLTEGLLFRWYSQFRNINVVCCM